MGRPGNVAANGTDLEDSIIKQVGDNVSGNIGIGTASPGARLTVNGTSQLANDMDVTRRFDNFPEASIVVDNVITTGFAFQKLGGGNMNTIKFLANTLFASGNLGLGTTTPGAKLTVNGTSQLANDMDVTRRFDNFPEASIVVDNVITTGFVFQKLGGGNINTIKFLGNTLFASGNLGLGVPSPAEKLDVNGTVKATGFNLPTGAGTGK